MTDPLRAALEDLFPAVQRARWPFTVEQAATALRAALAADTARPDQCPICGTPGHIASSDEGTTYFAAARPGLDVEADGWRWECVSCDRPVPPMGMCETCGVFGVMRLTEDRP